jgi:hypothetical protein
MSGQIWLLQEQETQGMNGVDNDDQVRYHTQDKSLIHHVTAFGRVQHWRRWYIQPCQSVWHTIHCLHADHALTDYRNVEPPAQHSHPTLFSVF